MSCEFCKGTNCILSTSTFLDDGSEIFADLRFDLDFNQFDIHLGTLDANRKPNYIFLSDSLDIKFCPFCGTKLSSAHL